MLLGITLEIKYANPFHLLFVFLSLLLFSSSSISHTHWKDNTQHHDGMLNLLPAGPSESQS